jgi:hypothetical protein
MPQSLRRVPKTTKPIKRHWFAAAFGAVLAIASLVGNGWSTDDKSPSPDPASGRTVHVKLGRSSGQGYITGFQYFVYVASDIGINIGAFIVFLALGGAALDRR